MTITCEDREGIFLDGTAEEWAALEVHATHCTACTEQIRAWKALRAAAAELRDYREDSALWAKIESSLRRQEAEQRQPGFWEKLRLWSEISLAWRTALASALVLLVTLSGVYVMRQKSSVRPGAAPDRLLKNSALAEVQRTERDYMKAIDKLDAEAQPELNSPATPLMASYKEKLMVLDSAIDELRMETGRNPSNAHLRYELLAMYQEKQETLQEVLETKR